MDINIAHSKTNRRIKGRFEISGSRDDLIYIANQIGRQCEDVTEEFCRVTIDDQLRPIIQKMADWD